MYTTTLLEQCRTDMERRCRFTLTVGETSSRRRHGDTHTHICTCFCFFLELQKHQMPVSHDDSVTNHVHKTAKYCYQHASSWLSGTTAHQSASTLNLGNEPWVMTPLPHPWSWPCPWSFLSQLFLFLCFLFFYFRTPLPFWGRGNHQHIERGGFPNSKSKSKPAVSAVERDLKWDLVLRYTPPWLGPG